MQELTQLAIPAEILRPAVGCKDRRFRLVLWWLTFRLPIGAELDEAAVTKGCEHCRYSRAQFAKARKAHPIHWERVAWKRELRRRFLEENGWCPASRTPGWPLGVNADQVSVRLARRKAHPSCPMREPSPGALGRIAALYRAASRIGDANLRANAMRGLKRRMAAAMGLAPTAAKLRRVVEQLSVTVLAPVDASQQPGGSA